MARTPTLSTVLAGIVMALVFVTGCRTPPPVYVVEAVPEEVEVPCPPPRPRLEVPPEPPDESYVWQPGYWNWDGDEYDWVDGCWVEPRPGYFFVEASFTYVGGVWRYRPPYWRPHRRHHRHRPGRDHGTGPKVAHGGDGPAKHRAPPAELAKHRAPPAGGQGEPAKHAAPAWSKGVDPDGSESTPPMALAARPERPGGLGPVKGNPNRELLAGQEAKVPEKIADEPGRPESIRIAEPQEGDDAPIDIVHDQGPDQLRQRPDFRGVRDGRMVFGDDPAGSPRTYHTDATGAIVLAPGARTIRVRRPDPRGGLVVHIPVRQGRTVSASRGEDPPRGVVRPWPRQQVARRDLLNRPISSGWRAAPRVARRSVGYRRQSIRSSAPRVTYASSRPRSFHRPAPRSHYQAPVRRSMTRSWSVSRPVSRPAPTRSVHYSAPRTHVSRGSRSVSRSHSSSSRGGRGGRRR